MRLTTNDENEGTKIIEWTEGGEFPDRDDCVHAILNPEDLIPNLIHPPDSIASLSEWIGWMEKSIADRRREDELNDNERWCITGIQIQKYGVHEDVKSEVPIFNENYPPSEMDILKQDGFIFRKSVPFDEVNKVMGLTGDIVDRAKENNVRVDIDYFSQGESLDSNFAGVHTVDND